MHSSAGAIGPATAYVGKNAISSVDAPISISDATSVDLRPMRSPKWPKAMAPTGRATKARPKVMNASSVCAVADCAGKNSGPITSAEAVA